MHREITPLTVDQIAAAVDDPTDFHVSPSICELVGFNWRGESDARFNSWMLSNGWRPTSQAAGNIQWRHDETGQHLWLDSMAHHALADMIAALRGARCPKHASMRGDDERSGLEILREAVEHGASDEGRELAKRWTGGGLFIYDPSTGVMSPL